VFGFSFLLALSSCKTNILLIIIVSKENLLVILLL